MASETIDSANWSTAAWRRSSELLEKTTSRNNISAVERIRTSTERVLSPPTLPIGLRRQTTLENERTIVRAAERIRTSTVWPLMPVTLPLVYGGAERRAASSRRETRARHRGNAGTCTQMARRRAVLRTGSVLYRQHSRGVIDGTRTRFSEGHILGPRRLRHRSQSALEESHLHRPVIGRALCC
jgi:hypothetical protein